MVEPRLKVIPGCYPRVYLCMADPADARGVDAPRDIGRSRLNCSLQDRRKNEFRRENQKLPHPPRSRGTEIQGVRMVLASPPWIAHGAILVGKKWAVGRLQVTDNPAAAAAAR
jgi:hypothetical protein